jgi:hypothetical protein
MARRRWWIAVGIAAIAVVAFRHHAPIRARGGDDRPSPMPNAPSNLRRGGGATIVRHITGRVVFDGKPIAATVLATGDGPAMRAGAAADGRFALDVVPGIYWARAFTAGVIGPSVEVDVRDADRGDVVLVVHVCTRQLVGRVTDSSGGAPIAGAQIDGGTALTNPAGQFVLCDMNDQTDIVAEAAGFASAVRHLMPGQTDVDFALMPEASLSGIVVGPDRAPVPDAVVHVAPSMRVNRSLMRTRNVGGTATTDSSGAFAFHGLGAGTYDATAAADGLVLAAPVTVDVTATTSQLVLAMRAADTIRGIARSAGKPVANVAITWLPDGDASRETTTRADGSFEIADTHFGHGMFAAPHYKTLRDVTTGPKLVELDLQPALEVRGRVVHGGAPVAGAEITGAGPSACSGEDGGFVVEALFPGTLQLLARSEALGGFSSPKAVTIVEGRSVDGVELDIAFTASVAGTLVDQAGAPIAHATVELDNDDVGDMGTATTRDDGSFKIAMLGGGRGSYLATVKLDNHVLAPIGGAATVAVPDATSAITGIRLAVTLVRGKLAGHVVDDRGAPIPDASIETRGLATRSDADGAFSLDVVGGKPYKVRVAGPPGMAAVVDAMPNADLRIVLHDPGSVHVTCASPSAPVGDITLYTATSTLFDHLACGATANDMPPGSVTGIATSGAMGQATVQPGHVAELQIARQPTRDVTVRVTAGSAAVGDATCWPDYSPGDFMGADNTRGTTDAAGTVVLAMAALRSRVWCWSPEAGMANATVEASADRVDVDLHR